LGSRELAILFGDKPPFLSAQVSRKQTLAQSQRKRASSRTAVIHAVGALNSARMSGSEKPRRSDDPAGEQQVWAGSSRAWQACALKRP